MKVKSKKSKGRAKAEMTLLICGGCFLLFTFAFLLFL